MERPEPRWTVREETVYIVRQDLKTLGVVTSLDGITPLLAAEGTLTKSCMEERTTLYRPTLEPTYGGPTLVEALWNEMDALMDRLKTPGAQNADGGDRFRAEELAWVLAIVTNPYEPSMDRIREETVRRWNDQQRFEAEQEAALNPEEDDTERWEENERRSVSNQEGLS